MTTGLYCRATTEDTALTPIVSAGWSQTSAQFFRAKTRTSKISDPIASVSFVDESAANLSIVIVQYISNRLTPGQTITGAQALKWQARWSETNAGNNLFPKLAIRVFNGTTVQKTILAAGGGASPEMFTSLRNVQFTATSAAGNYTTVPNDRLVVEIATSGDPVAGQTHSCSVSLGDAAASDLPENSTTTTALNSWIRLVDTLTFLPDGFYTDFRRTNTSGQHCFTGIALNQMVGYTYVDKQVVVDGDLIQIKSGANVVVDDVLLHKNGRVGARDLNLDTIVMPVLQASGMPDDLHATFFPNEKLPVGFVRTP